MREYLPNRKGEGAVARYRWTDQHGATAIMPSPGALLRSPLAPRPGDVDQPAPRRRARTADASAGAPGELKAGYPLAPRPNGNGEGGPAASPPAPTGGGLNPEEQNFDQAGPGVQVTGRDQEGKMWRMQIWGPHAQQGEGGMIGDRALSNLGQVRDGASDVQGLGALQRQLDRHYRR
jgi:hypothetical protein